MNENKVKIRIAREGDVDRIHNLVQRAFSNYGSNHSNPALSETKEDIKSDIRDNIVLVLEISDKIVGSLRLDIDQQKTDNYLRVHLKRFSIDPDFQGQGVGTSLYYQAEEELRKRNLKYVYLFATLENQKIVNFYKKLGFKCTESDRKNGYLRGLWLKKIDGVD